jgi:nicotinamide-nucleotide adenylyltransferase
LGFESLRGSQIVPSPNAVAPFHRNLAALDSASQPKARLVCGPPLSSARSLVVLPGSFNPPHRAHLALIDAAREAAGADAAAFVMSARTVDKERVTGMWLEDRLWLLCRLSEATTSVVVTNRGLYVEQAAALHELCPQLTSLTFVTGFDKIVQIFDARYYDDRTAALDELFARASFLVAPRGEATTRDLAALRRRPENAAYADKVSGISVAADLSPISSTRARELGDLSDVPEAVGEFVRESGCYVIPPPAEYAARGAAIRAAAGARS